jgi:hypothetical protein
MLYAQLLHQLSVRLRSQGQQLAVYDERWQYHGIDSFFNYDLDGLAAGRVVVGVTYDGKGNYSGAIPLKKWLQRLSWLLQPTIVADPTLVAAGLSTDSGYNTSDVAARIAALSEGGIRSIHVFANSNDIVPAGWKLPLSSFLGGSSGHNET